MTPRIASSILVTALLRRAEAAGGFGAVLAKGDPTAGSVLVLLVERGARKCLVERLLQPDGSYAWEASTQAGKNEDGFAEMLRKRRDFDPDLWVVELDVALAERFAAEMKAIG